MMNRMHVLSLQDFTRTFPEYAARHLRFDAICNSDAVHLQVQEHCNKSRVIVVPANMQIIAPYALTTILEDRKEVVDQIIIILEAGARLTLSDTLTSKDGAASRIVRSIRCYVQKHAQLTYLLDSALNDQSSHQTAFYCQAEEHGLLQLGIAHAGGGQGEYALTMLAVGNHARIIAHGACVLGDDQTVTVAMHQEHRACESVSEVSWHSVLTGNSNVLCKGCIVVAPEADNVKASQHSRHLILDDKAHVSAKPALDVKNHTAQCKHGSAIGNLDEQVLWYAAARGLEYQQAVKLLAHGFIVNSLQEPYLKPFQKKLSNRIF